MSVRLPILGIIGLVVVQSLPSGKAFGQCPLSREIASDATEIGQFGKSVAADGDFYVVGSPNDPTPGQDAGSVYVFERDGLNWTEETKLTWSDTTDGDFFGASVAIDGDYLAVGAFGYDPPGRTNGGAVCVFFRQNGVWTPQAKIVPANNEGANDDEFGMAVALDGNYLVVGSRRDDQGDSSGAAYVFERIGPIWQQRKKLFAGDAATGDQFGESVSINRDRIIVGARHNDDLGMSSGSAYIFRRVGTNWVPDAGGQLFASDGDGGDEFGSSVSIDGDYAVVGARQSDVGDENNAGALYVFHRTASGWVEQARLTASDATGDARLGSAVAIRGASIIAGAFQDGHAGVNSGSAYAFNRVGTTWTEVGKLISNIPPNVPASQDDFGFSVALSQDGFAIAGAPRDDVTGTTSGAVYLFGVSGDCNRNGNPDACDVKDGISNDFNFDGYPDECPMMGDEDIDGDFDLRDIQQMLNCYTSADVGGVSAPCRTFDVEPDDDIDGDDGHMLIPMLTGP